MKIKKRTRLFEWQENCKNGLGRCRCGETRFLTVDHIVPCFILEQFVIDRLEVLYNMEENFEILCKWCNAQKASRIDVRNPKTFEVLRKVIERTENELKR